MVDMPEYVTVEEVEDPVAALEHDLAPHHTDAAFTINARPHAVYELSCDYPSRGKISRLATVYGSHEHERWNHPVYKAVAKITTDIPGEGHGTPATEVYAVKDAEARYDPPMQVFRWTEGMNGPDRPNVHDNRFTELDDPERVNALQPFKAGADTSDHPAYPADIEALLQEQVDRRLDIAPFHPDVDVSRTRRRL